MKSFNTKALQEILDIVLKICKITSILVNLLS